MIESGVLPYRMREPTSVLAAGHGACLAASTAQEL